MVAVRLDFQDVGSCDVVVGVVGAFRLEVVFDAFLGGPALVSGSLGSHDPASGNIEVQRQLRLPSLRPATRTYSGAFVARSLGCMASTDAVLRCVADHKDYLAT